MGKKEERRKTKEEGIKKKEVLRQGHGEETKDNNKKRACRLCDKPYITI
jgi:hypothetical protein